MNPTTPNTPNPSGVREPTRGKDPEQPAERQRGDDGHDDLGYELVVRAEDLDDHVLRTGRLKIDHDLPDGVDRDVALARTPAIASDTPRPSPAADPGECCQAAPPGEAFTPSSCTHSLTSA